MNACRIRRFVIRGLAWIALVAGLPSILAAAEATEEQFDLLQIGTRTYTNVTVRTKAKNYIFVVHSTGMASIRKSELPPEIQQRLGYTLPGAERSATNTAAAWAKREIAKLNVPQIKELRTQLNQKWNGAPPAQLSAMGLVGPKLIYALLGVTLLLYLFYCYCCMLICRKAGSPPGILVWVPVLQIFPLLRAAGMSGWWFLGFCIPILNIIGQVLWCLNIAKARGKSVWVGVLLLLPVTGPFAFLYLAFSNGATASDERESEPKIMTLQTA